MGDPKRGIYHKFEVTRTDGNSGPGGKHEHCSYFVLDVIHDPHARAALKAYADSCRTEYPLLAADLDGIAAAYPFGRASQGDHRDETITSLCDRLERIFCISIDRNLTHAERIKQVQEWAAGFMRPPSTKGAGR